MLSKQQTFELISLFKRRLSFVDFRVYIGHIRIAVENIHLRTKRFYLSQRGMSSSLWCLMFIFRLIVMYCTALTKVWTKSVQNYWIFSWIWMVKLQSRPISSFFYHPWWLKNYKGWQTFVW